MKSVWKHSAVMLALATLNAQAGMTVITLTDMAKARIDALSFFIFAYFLIAWMVMLIWNHLGKTLTALPRLDYRRALGLVFLSGLMFYVVLTMISGAREILTPGAWEKQGVGYRMRENAVRQLTKEERRDAILRLKNELWSYAAKNGGKLPSGPFSGEIDVTIWRFAGGGMYCLVPNRMPGGGRQVLLYEPSTAGARRYVVLQDGTIEDRNEGVLKNQLDEIISH